MRGPPATGLQCCVVGFSLPLQIPLVPRWEFLRGLIFPVVVVLNAGLYSSSMRILFHYSRQILMGKGEEERMGPDVCANDQEQKIYNKLDLETTPDLTQFDRRGRYLMLLNAASNLGHWRRKPSL